MMTIEQRLNIRAPLDRCFHLARSVEVHVAGNVHWGEQAIAAGGVTSGLLDLGARVTFRARHFGIRWRLTSEITGMTPFTHFQDTMIAGPFQSMQHDHFFRELSPGRTEMRDVFVVSAPLGPLGRIAEAVFLRRYMTSLLEERNYVIKRIAESSRWRDYLPGCQ